MEWYRSYVDIHYPFYSWCVSVELGAGVWISSRLPLLNGTRNVGEGD